MNKYHKLIEKKIYNNSTIKLIIEKNDINYLPGQIFSVGVKGELINREYSSYNSPKDDNLEFLIKLVENGSFSKILNNIGSKDEFLIHGPFGQFTFDSNSKNPLFLCSGTGIAPFRSFIKSYKLENYLILHGIRYINEMYDFEDYKNDSYVPCISREKNDSYFSGRVTDYLQNLKLSEHDSFYICGNSAMISDSYNILKSKNIVSSKIYTESFF